jgi:hypothetical protein
MSKLKLKSFIVLSTWCCLVVLPQIACRSKKNRHANDPAYSSIEISNFGGITGAKSGYIIQSTGEIFLIGHLPQKADQQKFYRLANQDSVTKIFSEISKRAIEFNEPSKAGNLNYSLSFRKDSNLNVCTWSTELEKPIASKTYRDLREFVLGKPFLFTITK